VNGVSDNDSGLAYGVGATWTPGGGLNGVRADYTRYDFDPAEADTWSVGLVRRF